MGIILIYLPDGIISSKQGTHGSPATPPFTFVLGWSWVGLRVGLGVGLRVGFGLVLGLGFVIFI
jgi:hypothetical protein